MVECNECIASFVALMRMNQAARVIQRVWRLRSWVYL